MDGDFRTDLDKFYWIDLGGLRPPLRRKLKMWVSHFGLHCVAVYRMGRFARRLSRRGNPLGMALYAVYEVLCYLVKLFHHVDIFAADIGPGLYIGHVGTIYVGRTSIGPNFSITHNVTVGVGVSGGSTGLPVIGRDVWIGTGCILYGNIAIGDGVTVNGGTVLSRSVPDRCLVGGNPGRIILRNYDNARLFGPSYALVRGPNPPDARAEPAAGQAGQAGQDEPGGPGGESREEAGQPERVPVKSS